MNDLGYLAILGVIGLFGNIIAVVVQSIMNAHYAKKTKETAVVMFESVSDIVVKTNQVAVSTHRIVNNQRTQMLRMVASLAARIARDNPSDDAARIVAEQTEWDAKHASDAEKT